MEESSQLIVRHTELFTLSLKRFGRQPDGDGIASHREPEMIWVTQGRFLFVVDGQQIATEAGDILFVNPYEQHEEKLTPDESGASFYSFLFDSEKLLHFPSKQLTDRLEAVLLGKKRYPNQFPDDKNRLLQPILEELADIENAENAPLLSADVFRLFALLGTPENSGANAPKADKNAFLMEVLDYIGRINPSQLTLESIASHFNYSKNYFSQLFHRLVGSSVSDFCTRYKISCAQSLIRSGNYNLSEVCELSGFNHYTFFFRTFRRVVGLSPSEFIKKCEIEPDFRRSDVLESTEVKKEKPMNIQSRILSALVKVFENEDPPSEPESLRLTALRGEHVSFQIAYLADEKCEVRLEIKASPSLSVHARTVEAIPSEYVGYPEQMELDRNYLKTKPGKFPDCLREISGNLLQMRKKKYRTVWFEVDISSDAPSGNYPIRICLLNSDGAIVADDSQCITVLNADLPPQRLIHTEWFYADCIADYYGYQVFSEDHWNAIFQFMKTAVRRGINMIYTPLFTPSNDTAPGCDRTTTQLVGVKVEGDRYQFDFSRLERWIALAQSAGMQWFEMVHLSAPGAQRALKVMATVNGAEKQIFNMDVNLPDDGYARFLNAFLPALRSELEMLGVLEHCYFHISDEPRECNLSEYLWMQRLVAPQLAGCRIIDAVSVPAYVEEGLADIPVPETKYFNLFDAMHLPERWTYYCCSCGVGLSNRFFAMRLARTRAIGIQLFKYRIDGFLHWGYNFYNSCGSIRHLNPYQYSASSNDGGIPQYKAFPSGDAFLVYPGPDGVPEESIRLLALEAGMNDLRVLQELAGRTSYEYALSFVEEELPYPITFTDYPTSDYYYISLRNRVNRALEKTAKQV